MCIRAAQDRSRARSGCPLNEFFSNWACGARLVASAAAHSARFDISTRPRRGAENDHAGSVNSLAHEQVQRISLVRTGRSSGPTRTPHGTLEGPVRIQQLLDPLTWDVNRKSGIDQQPPTFGAPETRVAGRPRHRVDHSVQSTWNAHARLDQRRRACDWQHGVPKTLLLAARGATTRQILAILAHDNNAPARSDSRPTERAN
jgi:hypothetical protein